MLFIIIHTSLCTELFLSFLQVCIPFFLFCLGLNPKTDLSVALTSMNSSASSHSGSSVIDRRAPPSSKWRFSLLFEPSISSTSSSSLRVLYPFVPSAGLLNSAGHAMLQLLGISMEVRGSLLKPCEFFLFLVSPLLYLHATRAVL